MSAKIDITDGQHRRSRIAQAYRKLGREKQKLLDNSSVVVMITCKADDGGYASPCVLFRQGARTMITGAIPFKMVMERLISESAGVGSTIEEVEASRNRPEDATHSEAIGDYIIENVNGKFILPPLTLNISEEISVHAVEYPGEEPPTKNGMATPTQEPKPPALLPRSILHKSRTCKKCLIHRGGR